MSMLTALVLVIPTLLAVLVAWGLGARVWRRLKGSGDGGSAHVTASNGHHAPELERRRRLEIHGPVHALRPLRWQLVMAAVFVVAVVYYSIVEDGTPLPPVTCINGADASGHSWPDELGRPDPCAGYRR